MNFDLAFRSKNTITPEGTKAAMILIKDGKIAELASFETKADCPVIDLQEKFLLPGVIDPHVHINEPGRTDWEGFDTATKAAIAGGITTLVEMPLNASPVTTTARAFDEKIQATRDKLHSNIGFWGGIVPGNEKDIEPLIEKGVLGFKAFLVHSGIDEFPNVIESDLRKVMPLIAKYDLPLLVHCELETIQNANPDSYRDKNQNRSYKDYLKS